MPFSGKKKADRLPADVRSGKITASERGKSIIEASSEEQSKRLAEIRTNSGGNCTFEQHKTINRCQGMMYIHEVNIDYFASLEEGHKTLYQIDKFIRAT